MYSLKDAGAILPGDHDQLWLPVSELPQDYKPEIIECGEVFFDVAGYSEERRCYLLLPIKIDGSADDLEKEMEALGQ